MSSKTNQLKDEILNQISEQIKGLQISQETAAFVEGATNCHVISKDNIHVQCLLDMLDHVMLHGLERVELGYWPFVKELTHSETARFIGNHPQVTNDLDKGRVWIFTAVSDGLLESYIRLFVDSERLAKKFYTKKAFIRDRERLTVLQTLVSGLDFISFDLKQEWPYLGYGSQSLHDSNLHATAETVTIREDVSCCSEQDDNNSVASSSLSSASTITAPLSPDREAKGSSKTQNHVNNREEIVNGHYKVSSCRMDMNIQTDHITDNEDIVFDSGKKGSKKYSRGKNALEDEKGNTDGSLPREEFCKSPPTATSEHEIQERESYNELFTGSLSTAPERSFFRTQSNCSSLNSSVQSADSLDQFCRDFDSSMNLTSDVSLNSALFQVYDNKGQDLCDDRSSKELPTNTDRDCMLSKDDDIEEGSEHNTASYEGIILGLPKRPSLSEIPVKTCDISVDQNTVLSLSLEVFEKNGEQFHRMLLFTCGHLGRHLFFVHVLLTDGAIYLLKKVPSNEGASFIVQLVFPFPTLKKIEVGLNCQTVTLTSKLHKCVLFVADEAVTRDFLSSLTSMIVKSGQGSLLPKIVSSSTFQQETPIKRWLSEQETMQAFSTDIICFSFVQWCGLTGPDASVEVLTYKSVKEGHLDSKQPQYLRRTSKWTTSYFVLMNGALYQHANQGDEQGKIVVELRGSKCGGCRRLNDSDHPYTFEIVSEDGSPLIILAASSEEEVADWIFRLCQVIAETFDGEEDMCCSIMKCVPCCLTLTKNKVVVCLPDPNKADDFQFLSDCSVQSVTRLFVDNDVRNYCILEFERSEAAVTESSWFVWFKTEYELAKFERALWEAWKELFQVDLQFLVLSEGDMRETARQQAKSIEDLYKNQMT